MVEAPERPLIAKAEVFFAYDSNDRIESNTVDASALSIFKIGVSLRTSDDMSYEGQVRMLCEDVLTGEQSPVRGIDD